MMIPEFETSDTPAIKSDTNWSASLLSDLSKHSHQFSQRESLVASPYLPVVEFSTPMEGATESSARMEESDGKDSAEKRLASDLSKAITSGKPEQVSTLMRSAREACGGDPKKVAALGDELSKLLSDKGFDVKYGSDTGIINIHKQGSEYGVAFELARYTRAGLSDYREQTYDWVTKRDVDTKADEVISSFGKQVENGKGLKDASELTKLFDKAASTKDFTEAHRELARSALHAFKSRGADGVAALESSLQEKLKSEDGPFLVVGENSLTIFHGKVLSTDEALKAAESGGLKQAGIIKDSGRYLKPNSKGTEIQLPAKKK